MGQSGMYLLVTTCPQGHSVVAPSSGPPMLTHKSSEPVNLGSS